ncbi:peptide/nickel transport system substrate-binding protein [Kitasatospora gansuensis]|uniref:Peptide/nickel transport system substrate-binding protein n=1 Tax=Kitasatospora gansuensis TaxID=258050 RepID=A0A7W7S7U1_9ACTN|nr:ABC transporter substrate-binding protein [Kitasatospora gansuensis]MBB4945445.1 peptide/nickel transport system substrate-binding protein [Kitasatospora gansuensis]
MTRRTHAALAAAIAAALTLGLGACTSTGGSKDDANQGGVTTEGNGIIGGTPVKGGTLNILSNVDFDQLDPTRNWTMPVMDFGVRTLYRTLTTFKAAPGAEGLKIEPDLATDLGQSSDGGKTWTFKLKDGLKYEDGTPIVADDIKYNVERSYSPELPGGPDYARTYLVAPADYKGPLGGQRLGKESIETPDEKTIVFHLQRPVAEFGYTVTLPTFSPVPKAKEAGANYSNHPVSSGPYKIESYDRGKRMVLVRNTNWDPKSDTVRKAYPDKIVVDQTLKGTGVAERLITDQGDDQSAISYVDLVPSKISEVLTNPEVKKRLISENAGCTTKLDMNNTKAPFDNAKVRLAMQYAVDKEAFAAAQGGPAFTDVATTYLPPVLTQGAPVDHFLIKPGGDPTKAKALLAEAGFANGFATELVTSTGGKQQAEAIQAALKKVGVEITITTVDPTAVSSITGDKAKQPGLSIGGWCPDYPSAATFLPMIFDGRTIKDKGNQGNVTRFNDPETIADLDRIAAMSDVQQANKAWLELDAKIMDKSPAVPLAWAKKPLLVGSNIAGAFAHPVWAGQLDFAVIGLKTAK